MSFVGFLIIGTIFWGYSSFGGKAFMSVVAKSKPYGVLADASSKNWFRGIIVMSITPLIVL